MNNEYRQFRRSLKILWASSAFSKAFDHLLALNAERVEEGRYEVEGDHLFNLRKPPPKAVVML